MAIDSDDLAILLAGDPRCDVEIWRGDVRGALDESAIAGSWLPSAPDWEDVSDAVLLDAELTIAHDGRGATIAVAVADERKDEWLDDQAIAVVARARSDSAGADTGRRLIAWGYMPGAGRQALGERGDQTGQRVASYASYWERSRVPAHRLGRVNLAAAATVEASTSPLASTTAEAPLEYLSQENNDPQNAIDGEADTVYIGDIVADPTQPAIGDSAEVHVLRAYWGTTSRTLGADDQPGWIELAYVRKEAEWLSMTNSGAVPNLFEQGSNVRNDGAVLSSITTSGPDGAYYYVKSKTGQPSPTVMNGVQWNYTIPLANRAAKLVFEYKAFAVGSIGRRVRVTFKSIDANASAEPQIFSLGAGWQRAEIDLDSLGDGGGFMLRVQNDQGEVAAADLEWQFRGEVWVGYSDLAQGGSQNKLHLSYDDGNGHTDTLRIAWDVANGAEDWTIPPLGTVIVTNDEKLFRARFDPGDRQVYQLRNLAPNWFFGPGIGKVALRRGNGFRYQQYAPSGYTLVEEINFVTNGLSWTPTQGISRQSPIGTGSFAVEDYPHVGLLPGAYGGGYLWLNLGDYAATVLAQPLTSGATKMVVEDGDRIAIGLLHQIDSERVLVSARDGDTFTIARAQNGTTAAAHDPGDTVTPRRNGALQLGPRFDAIELRRRVGTPAIRSGVILGSNLASPGDPSVGGSKWERHPDWFLISRFDNPSQASAISVAIPGGVVEARHVCAGDLLMHRRNGVAQRLKINEIVVREWLPGATAEGDWTGHGARDVAQAAAHILAQHARMPAAKITIAAAPAPMGDLPITPAPVSQVLDNLAGDELRIWLDPTNAATIAPDPSNPEYDAREPYATLDADALLGAPAVDWGDRQPVAQVKGTFRETAALRTYSVSYPDRPSSLGEIKEIGPRTVRSWADARAAVARAFRAQNVRRTPQNVTIGPAPWARPWQRIVYDVAALDASGAAQGVNCAIVGYTHHFVDDGGGVVWTVDLTLQEIVL